MRSFYVVQAGHQLLKLMDPLFKPLSIKGFFFPNKTTRILLFLLPRQTACPQSERNCAESHDRHLEPHNWTHFLITNNNWNSREFLTYVLLCSPLLQRMYIKACRYYSFQSNNSQYHDHSLFRIAPHNNSFCVEAVTELFWMQINFLH